MPRKTLKPGQLHSGVVGSHPQYGGMATPQEDLDADDRRFGPEARFTNGPEGRDTMSAGDLGWPSPKPHEDTAPWRRRPAQQGEQLALTHAHPDASKEPAFRPTDIAQHVVRLKHPHLGNDYQLVRLGDDHDAHEVVAYHGENRVGYLRWQGTKATDEHQPGEIQGVSVHPDHRGKELSTAMWDYAHVEVALNKIQPPVHSSDRSTAGNHWAHFVGGASYARHEGHHADEYFKGEWR